MTLTRHNLYFAALLSAIYVLAWLIQDQLYLNGDVSQLLHATQRLLAGGTYIQDFFIPNPPMVMYLYIPPVLLTKALGAPVAIVFRSYIFLLCSLSLLFCYALAKNILPKKEMWRYSFISMLALVFLIIPFQLQGQRDCLLLVFVMPYMLAAASRLQGSRFSIAYAICIGVFAGFGFAMKPHFLALLIVVEAYYCLYRKNILAWMRCEVITTIVFLSIYTLTTWIFFQDYFTVIVQYLLQNYTVSIMATWTQLIFNMDILFCVLSILFWLTQYKNNPCQILGTLLSLATIAFIAIRISQRSNFLYHTIPAFSVAILLMELSFITFLARTEKNTLTTILTIIFSIVVSSLPLYTMAYTYDLGRAYKINLLDKFIVFMQTQPRHSSLYALTYTGNFIAPLADYTDATIAERFDYLWMTAAYVKRFQGQGEGPLRHYFKTNHEKYFFIDMIAEDFRTKKPDLVFVDQRRLNLPIDNKYIYFDFLSYFSENQAFRNEWKAYQYLTTIYVNSNNTYNIDIYQRMPLKRIAHD